MSDTHLLTERVAAVARDDTPLLDLRVERKRYDGRIVLASEHASRLPGWQEGSVTSALDAITRLHARVMQ